MRKYDGIVRNSRRVKYPVRAHFRIQQYNAHISAPALPSHVMGVKRRGTTQGKTQDTNLSFYLLGKCYANATQMLRKCYANVYMTKI